MSHVAFFVWGLSASPCLCVFASSSVRARQPTHKSLDDELPHLLFKWVLLLRDVFLIHGSLLTETDNFEEKVKHERLKNFASSA